MEFSREEPRDPTHESGVNLRAYFERMPDEKMRHGQVIEWDGDFRDDGALLLICSERDIEIAE